jgi:hypothetical protein
VRQACIVERRCVPGCAFEAAWGSRSSRSTPKGEASAGPRLSRFDERHRSHRADEPRAHGRGRSVKPLSRSRRSLIFVQAVSRRHGGDRCAWCSHVCPRRRARRGARRPTDPRWTDAIIRVSAACVCGSNLWPYRGVEDLEWPAPMGHEYVGIVEEVVARLEGVGSCVLSVSRAGVSLSHQHLGVSAPRP